jgi:sirohydrochlorin cobaltochelatase
MLIPVRSAAVLFFLLSLTGCASGPAVPAASASSSAPQNFGVLVMAHGGTAEWNQAVLDTVAPLRARYRVEVAFGMADAESLQIGVRALESAGVRKIGVVRLFVSGDSWFERTEQILGVRPGEPVDAFGSGAAAHAHAAPGIADPHAAHFAAEPQAAAHGPADPNTAHGAHGGHSMESYRIQSESAFALSKQGLADAAGMGAVLADRAAALSKRPELEDVLVLAHGPGDDAENARWLAQLDERAASIRERAPFRRVQVATLREDWPAKRVEAERNVRAYVERAAAEGGTAIVIPFRVHGFGPYKSVLDGLTYVSDGHGLIPHPEVARWLEAQIAALEVGPFQPRVSP